MCQGPIKRCHAITFCLELNMYCNVKKGPLNETKRNETQNDKHNSNSFTIREQAKRLENDNDIRLPY